MNDKYFSKPGAVFVVVSFLLFQSCVSLRTGRPRRPRQPGVVATFCRRGGHTDAEAARREPRCYPQSGFCSRNDPGRGPQQQGHKAATAALPMRMDFRESLLGTRTRSVRQTTTPTFLGGQHKWSGGGLTHALKACVRSKVISPSLSPTRLLCLKEEEAEWCI